MRRIHVARMMLASVLAVAVSIFGPLVGIVSLANLGIVAAILIGLPLTAGRDEDGRGGATLTVSVVFALLSAVWLLAVGGPLGWFGQAAMLGAGWWATGKPERMPAGFGGRSGVRRGGYPSRRGGASSGRRGGGK